ncbi:hypothetical protein [Streptomyces iconiensis]|uniref:Uncharacterized protein n=1 Tax=Streptomyces iconiensis TaxID=1384038 RepID=A0ABT6ZWD2_9ACTN|nr:hypothetical protein [Streptomyces iconiensis]MDJ1133381.1 hypothetical protein [Streptomyces iconiensis]
MGTWQRGGRRGGRRLPVPPPNPYGAHPGAGWAPPPSAPARRRLTTGRLITAAVITVLALAYVVAPLISALS